MIGHAAEPSAGERRESVRGPLAAVTACFVGMSAVTWLRWAIAGTLAVDAAPISIGTRTLVLAVFGALAAVAGWQYLRLIDRAYPVDAARLAWGSVVLQMVAATALPVTSNDVFSSLAYGRMAVEGLNPYCVGPAALPHGDPVAALVGPMWIDTPTDYGPIATALGVVAAGTGSVVGGLVAYKLVLLIAVVASIAVAYRAARDRRDAHAFALFAFNPLLAWEVTGQGHNDGLVVLGVTAALLLARRQRPWMALAAFDFALYAKLGAAPVLGLFLVHQWRASPMRPFAMAGASLLAGAVLYAPFWAGPKTLRGFALLTAGGPAWTSHSLADVAVHAAALVAGDAVRDGGPTSRAPASQPRFSPPPRFGLSAHHHAHGRPPRVHRVRARIHDRRAVVSALVRDVAPAVRALRGRRSSALDRRGIHGSWSCSTFHPSSRCRTSSSASSSSSCTGEHCSSRQDGSGQTTFRGPLAPLPTSLCRPIVPGLTGTCYLRVLTREVWRPQRELLPRCTEPAFGRSTPGTNDRWLGCGLTPQ